jgi:hypothetical protein
MECNCYEYCMKMACEYCPQVYKDLEKHVKYVCDKYDVGESMYPFPSEEKIEDLCDMVIDRYEADCCRNIEYFRQFDNRLFRDFALVLLLQRLLRRRRRHYYPGY